MMVSTLQHESTSPPCSIVKPPAGNTTSLNLHYFIAYPSSLLIIIHQLYPHISPPPYFSERHIKSNNNNNSNNNNSTAQVEGRAPREFSHCCTFLPSHSIFVFWSSASRLRNFHDQRHGIAGVANGWFNRRFLTDHPRQTNACPRAGTSSTATKVRT